MTLVESTVEMLRIDRHHPGTPSSLATTTALILSATGWTVRTTGPGSPHEQAIGSPDDNVESIVRQVESLHAISTHELTRVHAAPELAARLPLLLRPIAVDAGPPEPAWPDDVVEEEIWDWELSLGPSVTPVLYVNDARWAWWPGKNGPIPLPVDPDSDMPAFERRWAHLTFSEAGSMTSGLDKTSIGLVTPSLVCSITSRDEDDPSPPHLEEVRQSPAEYVVQWLLDTGDYTSDLLDVWDGREDLLARLFIGAALGDFNGKPVPGDSLMPGDNFGTFDTSEWTLTLDMPADELREAARLIAARPSVPPDVQTALQ